MKAVLKKVLVLSLVAMASVAAAQNKFPDGHIKMVVPFAPGGGVDSAAIELECEHRGGEQTWSQWFRGRQSCTNFACGWQHLVVFSIHACAGQTSDGYTSL